MARVEWIGTDVPRDDGQEKSTCMNRERVRRFRDKQAREAKNLELAKQGKAKRPRRRKKETHGKARTT